MYDLILKNGSIVDGTGKKIYKGSIGIKNGKIDHIIVGNECEAKAKRVIDCKGKHISPGFIDVHSHGDSDLGEYYPELSKLAQGITTHIAGHCGVTVIPISMKYLDEYKEMFHFLSRETPEQIKSFEKCKNYIEYIRGKDLYLNCKLFAGHSAIRLAAMGLENKPASSEDLELMKSMLRDAMENGALGMSTGLIYPPATYSQPEEILELCKVVKEYDGIYSTHLRSESASVIDAIKEAIYVAKTAEIPLMISHHKIMGKENWGLSRETLKLIDEEIKNGMNIIMDQYPYEAGMAYLYMCIPPQYLSGGKSGLVDKLKDKKIREEIKNEILNPKIPYENLYKLCGGFDGVLISVSPISKNIGKTIKEISLELNKDEFDTYFDLIIESNGEGECSYFMMSQEDMDRIISHPNTLIGTDGIVTTDGGPGHPRNYGTFPKAIRWYVKEKKLMSLETMINKMTFLAALKMRLEKKGALLEGYDADIVVFNYETITDNSTYENTNLLNTGIDFVIINGEIVFQDGVAFENGKIAKAGFGKLL